MSSGEFWKGDKNMMRIRALSFGIALLAAVDGYCGDLPEKISLTRGFAVTMALTNNPDLRTEALNSAMAETDVARSRGIYDTLFSTSVEGGATRLPGDPLFRSSNASASIGLSRFFPTGGSVAVSTRTGSTTTEFAADEGALTDWQSSVGITVSQPLLRNAGKETTELPITLAANALQDSVERFRSVATDTVWATITSYDRLYHLRKVLDSRAAALSSAQRLLDAITTRQPGPLQRMEIANAEYAIAQRRKDLVDAERNVSDQEASLRYLIGMETKSRIIPVEPPSRSEPPGTQEEAVQAALESRNDLRQLRLALHASQLQERVARHQLLPDLFAFVSGGVTGDADRFGESLQRAGEDPGTFWSAGMEFIVPLGNTSAENDYRRWKIRTEQIRSQIQALSRRIRNEVEADMRALISARLQMQTADRSAQYAGQRLEEYRKNNLAGSASVQDVINAENDLIAARNAQLDALETFANGVARLWRDTGELLERQGVQFDTSRPGSLMKREDGSEGQPPPD